MFAVNFLNYLNVSAGRGIKNSSQSCARIRLKTTRLSRTLSKWKFGTAESFGGTKKKIENFIAFERESETDETKRIKIGLVKMQSQHSQVVQHQRAALAPQTSTGKVIMTEWMKIHFHFLIDIIFNR